MLEVSNAGFRYGGGPWVFRNCSFYAEAGDVVAILGPNGRGKTTLLKAILGLVVLAEGEVRRDGQFAYVPQSLGSAFEYSVLDMVLMGRARHIGLFGVPKNSDYEAAHQALDYLRISHLTGRSFSALSGGERQLVLIARALASDCEFLILDEPASALDFRNQDLILDTLSALARERGLTILLTTHYPQHAVHLSTKVLLMNGSTDFLFGPTEDVMVDANLSRLYGMSVRNLSFDHHGTAVRTVVPVFRRWDAAE